MTDTTDITNDVILQINETIEYYSENPEYFSEYISDLPLYKKYRGMASHESAIINNNINGFNKQIIAEGETMYIAVFEFKKDAQILLKIKLRGEK
jgi:hypothetical protein